MTERGTEEREEQRTENTEPDDNNDKEKTRGTEKVKSGPMGVLVAMGEDARILQTNVEILPHSQFKSLGFYVFNEQELTFIFTSAPGRH